MRMWAELGTFQYVSAVNTPQHQQECPSKSQQFQMRCRRPHLRKLSSNSGRQTGDCYGICKFPLLQTSFPTESRVDNSNMTCFGAKALCEGCKRKMLLIVLNCKAEYVQGGFGFGQQSAPGFGAQPQAAAQGGIATNDNKQITHYTKWEEIGPSGQSQLLQMECASCILVMFFLVLLAMAQPNDR